METNEIVKAGEPYEYSFTIELRPEVELTSYEPVAIEMPFAEATDAEIDEQVEAMAEPLHRLRGRFRRYQDEAGELRRPHHEGHRRRRQRDRRARERVPSVRPGTGMFSEAFDEEILGMKKGQTKEFTLEIPEDETAVLLAGRQASLSPSRSPATW